VYNKEINYTKYILIGLVLCNIIAVSILFDLTKIQSIEVNFFDVGQGDSIFIQTPQNHQILIDGGPNGKVILNKLSKAMPQWDRTIDLIILTHPEHDHIAGLIEVLKSYKVGNIMWTGVKRDTQEYKEWQRLIQEEGANIIIAQTGQKIFSNSNKGSYEIEILYPFENLENQEVKSVNNTSIIARLTYGENSFLFTGDAFKSIENELVTKEVYLDSDVLKVGHHGSKTSTAQEFIEKVSPEIAVIQCGRDNRYGHPYPETLATLEKFDINILRTDVDGDIKIISNGSNLEITAQNHGFSNF
jgi:competence protein ComEC